MATAYTFKEARVVLAAICKQLLALWTSEQAAAFWIDAPKRFGSPRAEIRRRIRKGAAAASRFLAVPPQKSI